MEKNEEFSFNITPKATSKYEGFCIETLKEKTMKKRKLSPVESKHDDQEILQAWKNALKFLFSKDVGDETVPISIALLNYYLVLAGIRPGVLRQDKETTEFWKRFSLSDPTDAAILMQLIHEKLHRLEIPYGTTRNVLYTRMEPSKKDVETLTQDSGRALALKDIKIGEQIGYYCPHPLQPPPGMLPFWKRNRDMYNVLLSDPSFQSDEFKQERQLFSFNCPHPKLEESAIMKYEDYQKRFFHDCREMSTVLHRILPASKLRCLSEIIREPPS
jgi:hypothetical protein